MSIQTARLDFSFSLRDGFRATVTTPHGEAIFQIPTNGVINWVERYTTLFTPNPEQKPKKITAKQTKRASIRQENEVMEALGGRRQAGSGAVAHLKGDGRVRDKYRVEMKYTRANSYRVDRKELNKLRGECEGTEIPVFVIDFVDPQTGGSADRWVMVEFDRFQQLDYKPPNATGNHR
jgi:hypothetical protein